MSFSVRLSQYPTRQSLPSSVRWCFPTRRENSPLTRHSSVRGVRTGNVCWVNKSTLLVVQGMDCFLSVVTGLFPNVPFVIEGPFLILESGVGSGLSGVLCPRFPFSFSCSIFYSLLWKRWGSRLHSSPYLDFHDRKEIVREGIGGSERPTMSSVEPTHLPLLLYCQNLTWPSSKIYDLHYSFDLRDELYEKLLSFSEPSHTKFRH